MSHEKRLGWAALAMGLLGVAVVYLWPDKKWIGWTFLVAAALAFLAWIYLEIRPPHETQLNAPPPSSPEIMAEVIGNHVQQYGIRVKNLSGGAIYDLRIDIPETFGWKLNYSRTPHLISSDCANLEPTIQYNQVDFTGVAKTFGGAVNSMAQASRRHLHFWGTHIDKNTMFSLVETGSGLTFRQKFAIVSKKSYAVPIIFKDGTVEAMPSPASQQ